MTIFVTFRTMVPVEERRVTAASLFVDVDDTLILWSADAEHGWKCRPNLAVVRFVLSWRKANPEGTLVIWSLEGASYARKHGRALLPELQGVHFAERYARIAQPGDLYLDDDPFDTYRNQTINPAWLSHVEEKESSQL